MWDGKTMRAAHRVLWERKHGPAPKGFHLHHECHVPACVNPDHLRLIPANKHPHQHGHTHMTYELADEIRALYATGRYSQKALAIRYGFSQTWVGKVVRRESWVA
jgi:hypothetical protein